MENTSALTSSASIPLPPMPARGARGPVPNSGDFREMLATQGVQAPASGVPTETEARIAAAQIASKANVNAGVKRGRVLTGMDTAAPATPAVAPDRFLPLRQGPGAARNFTSSSNGSTNTVEALRATTKFAPGPVVNPNLTQAVPAVAKTIKRTAAEMALAESATSPASVALPKAVEAYTYGLRAASERKAGQGKPGEVPPWFGGALENALDKYDAMKAATP